MTRYPLPDNIDPPDDICVRVWIPNAPGYRRALAGAIAYLGKWYAWERDEAKQGKDAAARYRDAYDKTISDALAGKSCDCQESEVGDGGGGGGGLTEIDIQIGEMWALWEYAKMGLIDIKVQGGWLWKRTAPCCEWVKVAEWCCGGGDIYEDNDNPPTEFSACGRAYAMVDLLIRVGEAIYSQRDNNPAVWCNNVFAAVPGLHGGCAQIAIAVELSWAMTAIDAVTGINLQNSSKMKEVLCRLEPYVEATGEPLSDTEWNALASAISGAFGVNIVGARFWLAVQTAIGRGDMSQVAQLGARSLTQNCECPGGQETEPNDDGWYLSAPSEDLTIESVVGGGWAAGCRTHLPTHDVYGFVMEIIHPSTSGGDLKRMKRSTACPTSTGATIWQDTSGNIPSTPRACTAHADVLDSLFGEGNYSNASAGVSSWSNDPAVPQHIGGSEICESWQLGIDVNDTAIIRQFRMIHHIDSPSHG